MLDQKPRSSTTVRVWRALDTKGNEKHPVLSVLKNGSPGHATLETEQTYLSHWPKNGVVPNEIKSPVQSEAVLFPEIDECREAGYATQIIPRQFVEPPAVILDTFEYKNQEYCTVCPTTPRPPDEKITLHTLNTTEINKEVRQIQNEEYQLKVKSVNDNTPAERKAESCASSVYRALRRGGINDLSPSICGALGKKNLFAISPADIEACIKDAKKSELTKFPETASFDPINNTSHMPKNRKMY